MHFDSPLRKAKLVQRYKRFLADVVLESGDLITVHCPNTGTMATCADADATVYLSQPPVKSAPRKYPYRWELTATAGGYIGINTQRANGIVETGLLSIFGAATLRREVKVGNARFDFLLTDSNGGRIWVEVKNATLLHQGIVKFPDAVTERGRKHLVELAVRVREGDRAVMLFLVNRPDGTHLAPADHIDGQYGEELRRARAAGVEIRAFRAMTTLTESKLGQELEVEL